MSEKEIKIPVIELYGDQAIEIILKEIKHLKLNSNFTFDDDYINLGISFITIKATQIIIGERKYCELKNLVNESFGEAAIYKFNC